MNRFWPLITHCPPSRTAFARRPAGFEPAPGSVSANDATTSPEAMRGRISAVKSVFVGSRVNRTPSSFIRAQSLYRSVLPSMVNGMPAS